MCGRYTLVEPEKIYSRFKVSNRLDEIEQRFNVAPGSLMPVITRNSPNQVRLMKWGLIPHWAKDPRIGYRLINARAETVATKPRTKSYMTVTSNARKIGDNSPSAEPHRTVISPQKASPTSSTVFSRFPAPALFQVVSGALGTCAACFRNSRRPGRHPSRTEA